MRFSSLAVLTTALVASSAAFGSTCCSAGYVRPSDTTSALDGTEWDAEHFYGAPSSSSSSSSTSSPPVLMVFLPGTIGIPKDYDTFLTAHAEQFGVHTVGLTYPNDRSMNGLCSNVGEGRREEREDWSDERSSSCFRATRLAVITGRDNSSEGLAEGWDDMGPEEGIEQRLAALMAWLVAERPAAEGWAQFVNNGGELRWNRVLVAGHSQGAGHAAVIGLLLHRVLRVVQWGGVTDQTLSGSPSYLADAAASSPTPLSRFFGFVHKNEFVCTSTRENWIELGMGGLPTTTEDSDDAWRNSRIIGSDVAPPVPFSLLGLGSVAHLSYIVDGWIDYGEGGDPEKDEPLDFAAWEYAATIHPNCRNDTFCDQSNEFCTAAGTCITQLALVGASSPSTVSDTSEEDPLACDEGLTTNIFFLIVISFAPLVVLLCCCAGIAGLCFIAAKQQQKKKLRQQREETST